MSLIFDNGRRPRPRWAVLHRERNLGFVDTDRGDEIEFNASLPVYLDVRIGQGNLSSLPPELAYKILTHPENVVSAPGPKGMFLAQTDYSTTRAYMRATYPQGEDELVLFRRQFLQRVSVDKIAWPMPQLLAIWDVQKWVFEFVGATHKDGREHGHDRQVWKKLVEKVEEGARILNDGDVLDPLVKGCSDLCARPALSEVEMAQKDIYVGYSAPWKSDMMSNDGVVFLFERPYLLSADGCTGFKTWEAALHLSYALTANSSAREFISGKKVLELGAGTGLLSFVCARLEAERVVATDGDEEAIRRLLSSNSVNCDALPSKTKTNFGVYKWGTVFAGTVIFTEAMHAPFDVVLAADVTYDPSSFLALVNTFRALFYLNPATTIIIAATIRNEETHHKFSDVCSESGLLLWENTIWTQPTSEADQKGLFHSLDVPIKIYFVTLHGQKPAPELLHKYRTVYRNAS